jgi:hypothetical protein
MMPVIKPVPEVKKSEHSKCPYCGCEVYLHNDGDLIPSHAEHRSRSKAMAAGCPTLLPGFNQMASGFFFKF